MDDRIVRMKLDTLLRRAVLGRWPISSWEARSAEHRGPGAYTYDGNWLPTGPESLWPAGKTVFWRTTAHTPAEVPPEALFAEFSFRDMEGLLSVDGRPYAGLDRNHTVVAMPFSGTLTLEAEFICLPAAWHRPELRQERALWREPAFVWRDAGILAAYYDLRFAWEAAAHASDERRRCLLTAALEEALLAIDLTAPQPRFAEEVEAARHLLAQRVGAIAPDAEGGRILLTGHSHIDTAWLWPLRETVRKCARTFATACRLMERYPDYRFSCSQPQLYAYTREHYPALYEEIRRWVQAGRWECTGGMWVESDCNVPSGESLVRQILHGLRFFRSEFGRRPRTCWLPDVFGYPASLPQILKGCGLDAFYTNKLHWQARNPFPMHLFWWQGIDGTRLLAHIPKEEDGYNGWPNPQQLTSAWDAYLQKTAYPELLFPFGHGDGGGGPTEEMLEFAARANNYPGLPASRQGLEEEFFAGVLAAAPDLPTWVGELYLETHRGTYTTQAATKQANRRNELLLREAEIFGALAAIKGAPVDMSPLDAAWENLLLLQFHDILPGSSIGEVYAEAALDHAAIARKAQQVRSNAIAALTAGAGGDLVACNSLSWPRGDAVRALIPAAPGPLELVDASGTAIPVQVLGVQDGQAEIVFVPDAIPAMGWQSFSLRAATPAPAHSLRVEGRIIESRFFRLELDEEGCITSLIDRRCERELVPQGARANELQLFQDGPEQEAAWNIHATFDRRQYAWDAGVTIEVAELGPVRAGLRVTRRYRDTTLEQDILVYDRLPRIDFVTRVDWQARQVLLKAAFPLDVLSPRATYEVQFGAVERPTHRNTSWDEERFEVCAHRWADLSEAGYGVSLLNDSKYGYDVHGNVLRLSLLRGSELPDPDADRGQHAFTYALWPHAGDWTAGETVRRAWELNAPVSCVAGAGGRPSQLSALQVEGPAVVETLKPADDGDGWVLRLYEPHGGRGTVHVETPARLRRVVRTNLVEEACGELPHTDRSFAFAIRPFEIVTFHLAFL